MKSLFYRARRKRPAAFLPETGDFATRIAASGALLSNASAIAIDDFNRALMESALWGKIIDMGPFVGSWPGCLVKLKAPSGVSTSLVNVGFVAGDYAETGASAGLLGNAATKYLRTGTSQTPNLSTTGHLACYVREDMQNTAVHSLVGASNTDIYGLFQTSSEMRAQFGGATYAGSTTLTKGFFACVRSSATDLALYRNGVLLNTNATATTPANVSFEFYIGAENAAGTASNHNSRRISFYSIGQALSAAEMAVLYQLVQALQAALNRSV